MLNLKKLLFKICDMLDMIGYEDIQFTDVTISAGTPGTRGAQRSITWTHGSANALSFVPIYVGNSDEYWVYGFMSGNTIYVNFYRAKNTASSASTTVRVYYLKKWV